MKIVFTIAASILSYTMVIWLYKFDQTNSVVLFLQITLHDLYLAIGILLPPALMLYTYSEEIRMSSDDKNSLGIGVFLITSVAALPYLLGLPIMVVELVKKDVDVQQFIVPCLITSIFFLVIFTTKESI